MARQAVLRGVFGTAVGLLSATVACGDGGGPDRIGQCTFPDRGTFEADLTGAVTASIAGCADFYPVDGPPDGTNIFLLATVSPGYSMVLGQGGNPTPGTYPVQPTQSTTAVVFTGSIRVGQPPDTVKFFSFTSGSVTITGFDEAAQKYDASFTITGVRTVNEQPVQPTQTVTVSGTFSARCTPNVFDC
jgi:hypothetical protein